MKIKHFSNSFIEIKTKDVCIVCDPWVGIGNHGGWHSFPEFSESELIGAVNHSSHIYISHLHSDHFDPEFINKAKLTEKIFIIKKFDDGLLKKRLSGSGVKKIIEVEPFEVFNLTSSTSLSIVPQMTSNSAGASDGLNYDLDTSLIVSCSGYTFFNQVDNPLTIGNFKSVKKFIGENYGDINIACLTCGAAGEYPQCFLGIDTESEKQRIVNRSLAEIYKAAEVLSPQFTFIAGGTYFIPGKFYLLNKFIAQPSFEEIRDTICSLTNIFLLEGGKAINLDTADPLKSINQEITPVSSSIEDSILAHKNDLYQHQLIEKTDNETLVNTFLAAKSNYNSKINELGLNVGGKFDFKVYDELAIDEEFNILTEAEVNLTIEPSMKNLENKPDIIIHIENQAMHRCLTRKASWNQTLSGSLCLFERVPNIHEPEVLFSLNFLSV